MGNWDWLGKKPERVELVNKKKEAEAREWDWD